MLPWKKIDWYLLVLNTIGYWITKNEINPTSKTDLKKISTLCFDPLSAYHYSTEDTIYAVLFREIDGLHKLLKLSIIWVVSEKTVTLFFHANIKNPSFWSQNVHIYFFIYLLHIHES
jgi:hypothetical protein